MLDDFRQQASNPEFEDELPTAQVEHPAYFLGMSPAQRFIVAVMLLMIVCIVGAFALLVTEKVVPPFL
jgi:hypothetical protein